MFVVVDWLLVLVVGGWKVVCGVGWFVVLIVVDSRECRLVLLVWGLGLVGIVYREAGSDGGGFHALH